MANRRKRSKQFPGNAPRRPDNQPEKPPQRPASTSTTVGSSPGAAPGSPLFDSLVLDGASIPGQISLGDLPDQAPRVPMEYRAQVGGRCQRQYIRKPKDAPPGWRSDAQRWVDEWVERVDGRLPFHGQGLRLIEATIDWRLISNSGVDEGFIRPVIGAGGWPILPGSGIKGLFRRACAPERLQRWCGSPCSAEDLSPGILRFHGAWPSVSSWTQGLLDVAHPQQNWQVGFSKDQRSNSHSAFAVASLYQPKLQIGLSSSDPTLAEGEWQEIEATLRRALQCGLGGRTCVGYGSSGRLSGDLVFQCSLEGQGPAPKLLDQTPEFRPTMFRASIRGMALRLFGGLTDQATALKVVGRLFGSLSREEGQNVGLLATAYTDATVNLGSHGWKSWEQPIYATSGTLQWRLTRQCRSQESEELMGELLAVLHGLTMSLGGFGRGWRRPDHRIFMSDYDKTPIGCHWEWRNSATLPAIVRVQSPGDLTGLLRRSRQLAERWLQAQGERTGAAAPWREVIHPDRMLIWSRRADNAEDAEAIHWFHRPREGDSRRDPRDLRKRDLAGRVNQVGLLWNRLLPTGGGGSEKPMPRGSASPTARPGAAMARPGAATARPGAATARPSGGAMSRASTTRQAAAPRGEVWMNHSAGPFLESLVLFPEQRESPDFIKVMDRGADAGFERVRF